MDSVRFMHFLHATLPETLFLSQLAGAVTQLSEGAGSEPHRERGQADPLGLTAPYLHSSEHWDRPSHCPLVCDFSQPKAFWNGFTSCSETCTQIFPNMCI